MARAYVFLVHGVGKHGENAWAQPWKESLLRELQRYAPYKSKSTQQIEERHIRFVPISYDSIFEGYRERWSDLAQALADNEVARQIDAIEAIEWVARDQEQDDIKRFFWEKALDALLWYAVPAARGAVIAKVAEQITGGIRKMLEENASADQGHIVAHSLGTSVVHDALVSLTFGHDIHQSVFDPAHFKWQSISMVANTSRLLKAWKDLSSSAKLVDYKPYGSILRPGLPRSITHSFFNFRHVVDPITWPKQFDPFAWDAHAYSNVVIKHFADVKRVHDFDHYVRHPAVHLPMLRGFLGSNTLGTTTEVKDVAAEYVEAYPKTTEFEFSGLKAMLAGDAERDFSTKELIQYLVRAYKDLA